MRRAGERVEDRQGSRGVGVEVSGTALYLAALRTR